jgi:hypothetical protein
MISIDLIVFLLLSGQQTLTYNSPSCKFIQKYEWLWLVDYILNVKFLVFYYLHTLITVYPYFSWKKVTSLVTKKNILLATRIEHTSWIFLTKRVWKSFDFNTSKNQHILFSFMLSSLMTYKFDKIMFGNHPINEKKKTKNI